MGVDGVNQHVDTPDQVLSSARQRYDAGRTGRGKDSDRETTRADGGYDGDARCLALRLRRGRHGDHGLDANHKLPCQRGGVACHR